MTTEASGPFHAFPGWTDSELSLLSRLQHITSEGFTDTLRPIQAEPPENWQAALATLAVRLRENDPYFHPQYCGQMLKPPHPVARLAYALTLTINPNNHALDGGRATAELEKEAVAELARMIGWGNPGNWLGHLCGGGTIANFEALWVAREETGNRVVAASQQAHYTHSRLTGVLGTPFHPVGTDRNGRMCVQELERTLQGGTVGTVVATLGTTGLGAVDPLADIVELREQYGFRLHVDAAYGGYFRLAGKLDPAVARHYAALPAADSVVIDPHKHGLQPYGCGCVLFRDPAVARHYLHESPYTYYTSNELHLGEISLECSRAGAAAAALWTTLQVFPLHPGGAFSQRLEASLQAARGLYDWLRAEPECVPICQPELDIVVWGMRAPTASLASRRARAVFEAARQAGLYLALVTLPRPIVEHTELVMDWDTPRVTCLRSVLMKPEHADWLPTLTTLLRQAIRVADETEEPSGG